MNLKKYEKIDQAQGKPVEVASKDLKVGDIIYVNANERAPADCVLLYTTDKSGTVFIRTDQLDGETDWKVRRAISITQGHRPEEIMKIDGVLVANPPNDQIYDFKGFFQLGQNEM